MNDIYDMSAAIMRATQKAEELRPNSQTSIVWVSDGIVPIFFEDRDATEQILIRKNVIFNSLTVELRTLFKFLLPVGKPIAGWVGLSLYGSAKHLAQRSGGEAVKVGRVKDYGAGLSRIIGNLTARYSLGFALAESEARRWTDAQSGSASESERRERQKPQAAGEFTSGLLHVLNHAERSDSQDAIALQKVSRKGAKIDAKEFLVFLCVFLCAFASLRENNFFASLNS